MDKPTVRVYYGPNSAELPIMQSFYDGCPEPKAFVPLTRYEPSDVAVVFGVYKKHIPISKHRGRVIEKQRMRGLTTVVIETGYINRGAGLDNHYAVGLNGLNGRADFRNMGADDSRAKDIPLQPWHSGETILLCGQVPWDASVDFTNHVQWLIEAAAVIQGCSQRPIVFRPHPLAKIPSITGCLYSVGKPLAEDLAQAHVVVTFNSNSGVDAVLDGVPVYAFDLGSMVYAVANKDWTQLETPKTPERRQWLNEITHAQWTPSEMRQGLAWKHLGLSNCLNDSFPALQQSMH